MAWGLPKLPGLQFSDPTKTQFQLCGSLKFHQGHRMPDTKVRGPGNSATDVDSNAFALTDDSCNYDPSLTYGRVKQPALPQVIPHFVSYDKRCLNFTAFFKQPVYDSADEKFRVRLVNIIYFLEDDSMTVMEPHVRNSGIWQGRLVKRGKIPKNDLGEFWHWKDLDVGKDICIYGRVFHTCTCDLYTKEYLQSQGIELSKEEQLPRDPYTEREFWKDKPIPKKPKSKQDTLRQFLEYDGKILSFDVVWDNRDMPHGELGKYKLLYFLQDDTISVKELHDDRGGKDPFPLLLKKMKLPKKWMQKPVTFPSIVLETTEEEVTTYYVPKDLLIGETVFVLGRRFLIYDCDGFTRHYYKTMLGMDQPPRLDIPKRPEKEFPKKFPPHIGIGAPEDSLQSCFGLIPKPPYKDIIRYNLNANKYLRYLCELEPIHPEDFGRKFIFLFSLADSKIKIQELARRNSGRREGRFLAAMKLQLPDSDPSFPTYYTPDKFYIGAVIPVFKHRFKIIGCDLFVYRYMSSNPDKFPPQVIENVRNYHMREGNLKDELEAAARDEQAADTRAQLAKIGQQAIAEPSAMEKCLMALDVVEGSEMPLSQPTPPPTTDRISYDEYLHEARLSKPVCEGVLPLKGILKSGALPKDDQHKVVCFSGPETGDYRDSAKPMPSFYPSGQQPLFDDDPNFCDRYKEPNADIREELRARNICQYEISPKVEALGDSRGEPDLDKKAQQIPGYLGSFDVDCKEVPDYMRLPPDAYEKVKKIRKDVPDISPAAVRVATYPREPPPAVDSCVHPPPEETGPCAPRKEEDVSFACPHVQPILPCCPEDKQDNKNNETENTKL